MGAIGWLVGRAMTAPGNVEAYTFDRWLGVSTRGSLITPDSVFSVGGDNLPYLGSQWWPLRRTLLELAPGPSDVFVDFGSGKGKAVLVAGQLPFGRVIGVEIDEALAGRSKDNIHRIRRRLRADEVRGDQASALEWPIPDDLSVAYMFNPFLGSTFHQVFDRIVASFDREPRPVHFVYTFPAEHDWLMSTGRVVVEAVRPASWLPQPGWWRKGYVILVYRIVPAGTASADRPVRSPAWAPRAAEYWKGPNGLRMDLGLPTESGELPPGSA